MTKDEALKLALQALVLNNAEWKHLADSGDSGDWSAEDQDHYKHTEEAITAIKEALAQPEHGWTPERIAGMARLKDAQDKRLAQPSVSVEQEPVAWKYKIVDVFGRPAWTLKTPKSDTQVLESQPLYTTPPQRTWVGLTDDEIQYCVELKNPEAIAEEVEAKLKEKNT